MRTVTVLMITSALFEACKVGPLLTDTLMIGQQIKLLLRTGYWLLFKETRGSALAALMIRCICSTLPLVSVS